MKVTGFLRQHAVLAIADGRERVSIKDRYVVIYLLKTQISVDSWKRRKMEAVQRVVVLRKGMKMEVTIVIVVVTGVLLATKNRALEMGMKIELVVKMAVKLKTAVS